MKSLTYVKVGRKMCGQVKMSGIRVFYKISTMVRSRWIGTHHKNPFPVLAVDNTVYPDTLSLDFGENFSYLLSVQNIENVTPLNHIS